MISNRSSFLPVLRAIWDKIPSRIRYPLCRFYKWQYFGIFILVLITLILHIIIIGKPNNPVFDEGHYIGEARSIIAGQGPIFVEHPPLAKLFIVTGIRIFGDNPFGWRFFSVLFGTISIIFFYFICKKLEMPKGGPFLATFVFSFENLSFVQASIAMLDVYMVTFMLASFLLYLYRKTFSSGLFIALSALSKLTGVFSVLSVVIDWLIDRNRKFKLILVYFISVILSFILLLIPLNSAILGYWANPVKLLKYVLLSNSSLTFANALQHGSSKPWDWILQPMSIFYTFNPQYIAMVSLTVWAVIIIILIYMICGTIRGNKACRFGLSWFIGVYLTLALLVLVTNRVTFVYYFYPAIGAICIGIGFVLSKLLDYAKHNKNILKGKLALVGASTFIFFHLFVFILFSPLGVPFVNWLPLGL